MLIPLDEAMNRLWRRYGLFYVRYMDDFVVMAPTRHKLRRAIKEVHAVMGDLGLRLHWMQTTRLRVVPYRYQRCRSNGMLRLPLTFSLRVRVRRLGLWVFPVHHWLQR